jgi:hypothetical protein
LGGQKFILEIPGFLKERNRELTSSKNTSPCIFQTHGLEEKELGLAYASVY